MKQVELKNFVKKKLNKYLEMNYDSMRVSFSNLMKNSPTDERLAELAQSHYFLNDKHELSKMFEDFSKDKYDDMDEFWSTKYGVEYLKHINSRNKLKEFYRNELLKLIESYEVSMYSVAKEGQVSQSNLSLFLKKGELNKLSVKKVLSLFKMLNSRKQNLPRKPGQINSTV